MHVWCANDTSTSHYKFVHDCVALDESERFPCVEQIQIPRGHRQPHRRRCPNVVTTKRKNVETLFISGICTVRTK